MTDDSLEQASSDSDVFVSYASQDAAIANSIVEAVEQQGLRCWIAPRNVVPGSLYADGIVRAINVSKVLVLLLSRHAVASSHVGKEIERASSKGRAIIALRIDAAPLTPAFEYFLSESQWIDVGSEDSGSAVMKLVAAVRRHVDPLVLGESRIARDEPALGRTAAISEKSIAVLPFTDMSQQKDQEYFADGMAEEIINLLAKVPELLVSARTSSFYFKGKQTKIPEIARELGVVNVLEGSIRLSGNRLRVTTQLVRADTGYHLWSETYDRALDDVFKVQDDIANAVVQALQIKLMGGELSRQKGGTQNLEAYQLYLRAISANAKNTRSSLDAAGKYLDQATKLDPNFGMAWSALAFTAMLKTDNSFPGATYESVRQLAQHALQLSPRNADAHARLQYVYRVADFDWAAAEAEGRLALAIDPMNLSVLNNCGLLSATLGRWDDAERQFRAALARDPLNPFVIGNLGAAYYSAGRYAESEGLYRKLLELDPRFLGTRPFLARTLLAEGKSEEALAMVLQEGDEHMRLLFLPIFLHAAGHQAEAEEALHARIRRADRDASYLVAMTYAYLGERDLALQWLERAYDEKHAGLAEIVGEVLFKNLAHDPRFKTFLRKMNLSND